VKRSNWISLALVAAVIVIWEFACRWLAIPDFILPPPSEVAKVTIVKAYLLLPHAGVTALEIIAGNAIAVTCGSVCGPVPGVCHGVVLPSGAVGGPNGHVARAGHRDGVASREELCA